MSDPFAGDPGVDPIRVDASGVLTTGTLTYASTVDVALTNLYLKYAYDNGCATAAGVGGLPVMVLLHGYSGDANSFVADDLARWAARGFVCISVGMRGRNGAAGTRDNHGRERHDVIDAITAIRAAVPYAHATRAHIAGYSDGGGMALALRCTTDIATLTAAFFPLVDQGVDAVYGWYNFWGGAAALLDVDIGGSPAALPKEYATRNVVRSILRAQEVMANGATDGWTYLLHDEGDTLVSVAGSDAINALAPANLTYTRTTAASPTRALHGHPSDHPGDLPELEWIFALSAHDRPALALPTAGSLVVLGFYKSVSRDFEVWLDADDSTGSPRTNGTGGRNRMALLAYDTAAQTLRMTPLLGPMRCYVRMGAVAVTAFLHPNEITIFDAAAGTISTIDNDLAGAPTGFISDAPTGFISAAPITWAVGAPTIWTGDYRSATQIVP